MNTDRRFTTLMYHAVPAPGSQGGAWDSHYAVGCDRFTNQVRAFQECGLVVTSVRRLLDAEKSGVSPLSRVCFTFDDGTCTDAQVAAPVLASLGAHADFFVNPATVGTKGFVSWGQLRRMAELGMSIQSHGQEHRFLDELSVHELQESLVRSKSEIEEHVGQAVTLLAPPGGRLPQRAIQVAMDVGYEAICSSRPGRWKTGDGPTLPRFAVLAGDSDEKVLAYGRGDLSKVLPQVAKYTATWLAKKAIGNQRYVAMRSRLLGLLSIGRS